jgi:hypothetical protein
MINLGTNHAPAGLPVLQKRTIVKGVPPRKPEGRPTVMTPDVLRKLEDAFTNAFTDEMACLYAGIGKTALYDYCQENKEFAERKELLKSSPNLKAQNELVKGIEGNVSQARWWAEHRMPDFMPKTKVEHSGEIKTDGAPLSPAARAVALEYEEKLRQAIVDGGQKNP